MGLELAHLELTTHSDPQRADTHLQWLHLRGTAFPENQTCSSRQHASSQPEAWENSRRGGFKNASSYNESPMVLLRLGLSFPMAVRATTGAEECPISAPPHTHWGREEEEGAGSSEAQVAACFLQGLLLIFFGWLWLPVWERGNAGRKFFKRLNYYCFLCGCLRWCMKKKALRALEKRFVWIAELLWFISPKSGFGQFPQESGWLGPADLSMA